MKFQQFGKYLIIPAIANVVLIVLNRLILAPSRGNAWGAGKGEDMREVEDAYPQYWERQVLRYGQALTLSGQCLPQAVQLLRGRAQAACSIPAESFFFPHRTSRLGPAEVPAAKAVHSEGGPCSAFPPGPAQADLVSASCSGGCSYSYRYLFKEPF